MMRPAIYLLFSMAITACQNHAKSTIEHYGVLREIMRENKLEANMALSSLKQIPHVYAIGALEGLEGEILIIDSKPVISKANKGLVSITQSFDYNATLLVKSEVEQWQEFQITTPINSLKQFEAIIKQKASEAGLTNPEAFPFILKGSFNKIDWHIINAKEASEASHEAYKEAGFRGSSENTPGEILGFYSQKHEGIFTHHGSFLHMHFVNDALTEMGHVDALKVTTPISILLPKIRLQ